MWGLMSDGSAKHETARSSSTSPPPSGPISRALPEADLNVVLHHIADGVAVCKLDRFVYANKSMLRLLAQDGEKLAERTVSDVTGVPWDEWTRSRPAITTEGWRRSDGAVVRVEVTVSLVSIAGGKAWVVLARDATTLWQSRAQLEQVDRLAAVGSLAAGVAHQLNNPLAAVITDVNFLADELHGLLREAASGTLSAAGVARAGELLQAATEARDGAQRVAAIVRDLQTLSRTADERRVPIDVRAVLDSAAVVIGSELEGRAKLVKEYEPVPLVVANESLLAKAFLSVLLNAVQAVRKDGSPHQVVVRTYMEVPGPHAPNVSDSTPGTDMHVVVEIVDDGQGMTSAVRERIFDPFFTVKPVGIGTGLGLTTALATVTSLGGRIDVESEEGRGATFRIVLPARSRELPRDRPAETPLAPAPTPQARPRMLIVDDEQTLISALRRVLVRENDVESASSARAALAILEKDDRFDVILCDIMMPDMTGIDFFQEVERTRPHLRDKFIFMTGGAFTPVARAFLDSIDLPRLEKPFDLRELRHLLRQRLKQGEGA